MKKKILFIIGYCMVTLLFAGRALALGYQPFPSDSATWKIVRCNYYFPAGVYNEITLRQFGTDTTINGNQYKNIFMTVHALIGSGHDTTYTSYLGSIREANKKIYFVSQLYYYDSTERLIYDFTYNNVGDTIYTDKPGFDTALQHIPHVVNSIDSVLISGVHHRRLYISDTSHLHFEYWIEGVGSTYGLLYATHWETDNSYDLICYKGDQNTIYTNPSPGYGFCNFSTPPAIECAPAAEDILISKLRPSFTIFPNPVKGQSITLTNTYAVGNTIAYNITDMIGRQVAQGAFYDSKSARTIDVSAFANGVYFISLKISKLFEAHLKFVKAE